MVEEQYVPKISNEEMVYWKTRISPEYRELAQNIFQGEKDYEIGNSNLNHAMFLSFLLIKRAKVREKIRIFTKRINGIFFNNSMIRKEFDSALDRGVEIDILVSEGCENDFLDFKNKRGITIYKLKKESEIKNHFLLSGDSSFRIEEPHTDKDLDEERIKGFANFNDPDLVGKISSLYDNFLLKGSEVVN